MMTKPEATRVARYLGAGLLSASILAWVADRSGPAEVDVVIHVMAPDVEVSVGGHVFRVEGRRVAPLVCRLAPGRHDLITRRGGRVLSGTSSRSAGGRTSLWWRGTPGGVARTRPASSGYHGLLSPPRPPARDGAGEAPIEDGFAEKDSAASLPERYHTTDRGGRFPFEGLAPGTKCAFIIARTRQEYAIDAQVGWERRKTSGI